MGETRVQTATLVCKIFLRYLDQLPNAEGMLELWLKILDILDRMMNSGQGDSLVSSLLSMSLTSNTRYLTCRTGGGHSGKYQEHNPSYGRSGPPRPALSRSQQGKYLDRNKETPRAVFA